MIIGERGALMGLHLENAASFRKSVRGMETPVTGDADQGGWCRAPPRIWASEMAS